MSNNMTAVKRQLTIVVSTIFQDAGDATRAIEIAKGIRKYSPRDFSPRIIFLSHGSRFEQRAVDNGFEIYHTEPKVDGIGERHDYKMTPNNFIGNKYLAKKLIEGEVEAYKDLKPDVVLFGFWPMAGLAYRMMGRKILGICYVPVPCTTEKYLDIVPDIPEQVPFFSKLPFKIRKLMRYLPLFIKRRVPPLRQPNILWAACKLGWKGKIVNLFDMLEADLTIVNDLPDFYLQSALPEHIVFSGPLFCKPSEADSIDPQIRNIFSRQNSSVKIFCTLGSSGTKDQLLEIVKVFTYGEGLEWSAVILSPISVCPIEEAKGVLGNREGVYITDSFVPAQNVNALADIVICHGGQGTLQTALHSGTPLVGVAAQAEQFLNLYNIESKGAGIRIPMNKWNAENIQKAVHKIITDKKYSEAAIRLKERMDKMDGERNSAEAIWKKIIQEQLPVS
jgi:UDP:flavonoid glycosyltransferase YjiC (YdhE family)